MTLTHHLDTFADKHAVENAVQRVAGVRAIAVELDVKLEPQRVARVVNEVKVMT